MLLESVITGAQKLYFISCCIMITPQCLVGGRRTDFAFKVQTCFETTAIRVTLSHGINSLRRLSVSKTSENRRLNSVKDNRSNSRRTVDSSPPVKQRLPGVLLVVEGLNDMRAIKRCLEVDVRTRYILLQYSTLGTWADIHHDMNVMQVYVLGSATRSFGLDTINDLKQITANYKRIVLFLDPDVAGRQARNEIDRQIQGCWHAFLPTRLATATVRKKYKDVGDIGIEHASPKAIITGLARSRMSRANDIFSRDYLVELGLIAPLHQRVRIAFRF